MQFKTFKSVFTVCECIIVFTHTHTHTYTHLISGDTVHDTDWMVIALLWYTYYILYRSSIEGPLF